MTVAIATIILGALAYVAVCSLIGWLISTPDDDEIPDDELAALRRVVEQRRRVG